MTMKLLLTVCVFLGIFAQLSQVGAVTCTTLSTCEKTEFTAEKCESKVCQCVSGYAAVQEGCIKKPAKPTVTIVGENNDEALGSTEITLSCDGEGFVSTYKWLLDGTPDTSKNSKTEKFNMVDKNLKIQCSQEVRNIESETSDVKTIKFLGASGPSTAKPIISFESDKVAAKKTFTVSCTGFPHGFVAADVKLTDKDDNSVTGPVAQLPSVTNEKFTCEFEKSGYTFPAGPTTKKYPDVIDSIVSVEITPVTNGPAAFRLADAPEFTCQVSPAAKFLPAGSISYEWKNVQVALTTATWQVDKSKAGVYDGVSCTATLNSNAVASKVLPKITINNDYLKKPVVKATPTKPVVGSQVAFTCATDEAGVQVSWELGGSQLVGQTDKTIQFGEIATSLSGDISCSITKDGFIRKSDVLTFTVQAEIEKPEVDAPTNKFGKLGEMKLTCKSDSAVPAMKYSWKKGGNSLKGATLSTYKKDEVKDGDAGKYTCTTTFAALPAKTSDEFEVSIIPPGPICSDDGQCDGNKKSLTGKCDKEKKRCVCAGGFAPKGNECDGVGQMVASLLLVLVAAIFARLM